MNPFRPVKIGKISPLIVRQIKNAILNGTMKPGDRLPPERELTEHFQASRISVREALKSLETSGLLTIKPGSGAFVAEVSPKPLSESLSSILRIQRTSMNDLTEARIILEPSIARLACERMTSQELQKLETNIQETLKVLKSGSPAPIQNIEFHSIIANATHNPVIILTVNPLFDVLKEMNLEMRKNIPNRMEVSSQSVTYHKKILKAFRERDSQKVHELMLKHIFQMQEGLKKVTSEKWR
jgi:GntR family transcriptional repressor for pyruvate dehydrogenase complex